MSDDAHGTTNAVPSSPPPSAAGPFVPPPPTSGPSRWLPGLWVLRHYQRAWLPRDVGAGLVLTALLVPAGLGYAEAAGLPPVTGLYATILPLLAYALVGPSRIMVLGPDSALAPLIAAAVVARSGGDPARAVSLACVLALMSGALCIAAAALRAGAVTDLLSKPVRVGYMNGIALTILVGQVPKLLGFSVEEESVLPRAVALVGAIVEGRTAPATFAIGGACLAAILVLRRIAPRVPGVLFAVAFATLAVALLHLEGRVDVVGPAPRGIPRPHLPHVTLADVRSLFVSALGITVVSFADTTVISRTFAGRHAYRVDPNRELLGLGAANVAAGLFGGFPISSSASRTPVAEAAGARTQLTGVVGALAIVALLVAAPGALKDLPLAALAAVVIAAALRMFDFDTLRTSWRVRRSDFVLSLVAFGAVAAIGVLEGIGVAVAVSLLDVVRRVWRPHDAVLGRVVGLKGYHDVTRYPRAQQVPGLLLFRWDAPLFFANADGFRERVLDLIGDRGGVRWVVIAAEPITDVDTTAAEMLDELDAELARRGAELAFAEVKDPVRDRLAAYGFARRVGSEHFFPTIGVAVKAYLSTHDVAWDDWEDHAGKHSDPRDRDGGRT